MARRKSSARVVDTFVFQARIIDYLEGSGMKAAKLADSAGISRAVLSYLLSDNTRRPDIDTVVKLAYAMEVHPWELMVDAGYPLSGPAPARVQERTRRILEKEPRLEQVIHGWELQDPLLKESLLAALEALVSARRNGQESLPRHE